MASPNSAGPPVPSVAEVCRKARLGQMSQRLACADLTPGNFLKLLLQEGRHADAIRFMAQVMRSREVIWWACLCVRHSGGTELSAQERAGLQAAVEWVRTPSPRHQEAAQAAADALDRRSPAGNLARAVQYSGSAPVPGDPIVPVQLDLARKLVVSSIMAAGANAPPGESPRVSRQFIAIGLDIEAGKVPWE